MIFEIIDSTWEVEIVPANSPELLVDGSACNGTPWFTLQRVYLSSVVPKNAAKRLIIHELTHAFLYVTQMTIPEKMTEEEVCDFFGCWGCQIIRLAEQLFTKLYNE